MTGDTTTIPAKRPDVPIRTRLAIYGAGLFSNSMTDVASVVLPLWLASMGYSAATIGIVVGAKHVLPLFFAIHGGALIDRLGARRVMLASAMASAVLLPLFPMQGFIVVIIVLQMLNGMASALCWIGAQACFGRVMHGHADYAGPFAFALRVGSFIGPPLGGLAYDIAGIRGGIAVLTLWALGALAAAYLLPPGRALPTGQRRVALADLLPRVSDYAAALKLTAQPAMATVLMITVFRIAASSIQDSFYPIYLKSIGFRATEIGVLITVSSAFAAAGALSISRLMRHASGLWLLIATTMGSILFIAVTPLFSSYWLLMILAALRGVCLGVSQPLMLSLLVGAAERNSQGLGVSLRTTANRAAAAVTPMTMGMVAAMVGLSASFLLMGGVLMGGIVLVARRVLRPPTADLAADPAELTARRPTPSGV